MDRQTAINEFLQRYAEDWAQGSSRSLEEYRELLPGHEALVEEQYALIHSADAPSGRSRSQSSDDRSREAEAPTGGQLRPGRGVELGPYALLRELGRGGQGEVWLAEDGRIGRKVALKTLTAVGQLSAQGVERLRREARVASRLDHPGICTVYEADQIDGVPFLAMQWVEGMSLSSAIRRARDGGRDGPLPLPAETREQVLRIASFFREAALALQHAHDKGVLHRDVKPGNILLDAQERPVLHDFGLARDLEGEEASISEGISGTPAYLAPERLAIAASPTDSRVDVYGMGVALYETLTLERPFGAATREHLFRAILETQARDPRRANPAIPRELAVVIATAMAKEPDRRYESAAQLADDLAAVCEQRPIAARPPSTWQRVRLWAVRHPRLAWISALLAIATLTIAALAGFLGARWPDLRAGRIAAAEEARRELLEIGFGELGELHRGDAATLFERALASAPDDVLARSGLALAKLSSKRPREALAVLDAHPRAAPAELSHVRAEVLRWCGEWDRAEALVASLPAARTGREHFVLGTLELFRGHQGRRTSFEPAVQHLLKTVLHPGHAFAFHYVGLADALSHAPSGDWEDYVAEAMMRGWPDRYDVQLYVGVSMEQRDPARARRALERALSIDPKGALASIFLADVLLGTEGVEAAREHLVGVRELCRSDATRAMLARVEARVAVHAGQPDDALEHYWRAVHLNPGRELHSVDILRFVESTEAAEREHAVAREILRREPSAVRARVVIVEHLMQAGAIAEAAALLDEVHALTPWHGPAHHRSALILAARGPSVEAVRHFERALECQPAPTTRYELLRARLDVGHLDGLAEAARELPPASFERAERLALVAETTAHFLVEGVPQYSATLPATPTQLEAAARALELSGRFAEAATAWTRFSHAGVSPASSMGTSWWRIGRAGLLAAGDDPELGERPLRVFESELDRYARAWFDGKVPSREFGELLHRFEADPAFAPWRDTLEDEAWIELFESVRELRSELFAAGGLDRLER